MLRTRRPLARRLAVPLVLGAMAALTVAGAGTATASPPSPPLSAPGYTFTPTLSTAGVTVYAGALADPASHPAWTVTIAAPATSSLTGAATTTELGPQTWATQTAQQLQAAGYDPVVDAVPWPAGYVDTPHGVQGYRVRTGRFATQAAAQAAVASLKTAGFASAIAEWTGYDADQRPDAEQVHVAVVDPRRVSVSATHGSAVASRTTTSALAAQTGATVAVNGGFFVTADADGFQGVPSGLAAYHGALEALAVGDRAALVLSRTGRPSIRHLVSTVTMRVGSSTEEIDGLNRKPGAVRDCGRPGLQPTTEPRQDFTCTAADDAVLFTAQFGAPVPTGSAQQVVVDRRGRVVAVGPAGGSVPTGGSVVQAVGQPAQWITAHVRVGQRVTFAEKVVDDRTHRPVDVAATAGIVSAAPTLLHDGRPAIDAATEGVIDPADRSFNYAWGEIRQPRTIAGIDAKGRLLLVTVDGRGPGVSEGLTLSEEASLMRSLGAVEAMNLDGGGSTAMAVNGTLVNHPSDATGERAIGDAVVVTPRR